MYLHVSDSLYKLSSVINYYKFVKSEVDIAEV